ncbi:glycosyltransferase, partial [Limnoraphis robusta]
EAAACGLPIICEDVGAVQSYLDENAVFYVKPNDSEAVINKFSELVNDRIGLLPYAEEALKQVQKWEWAKIAEKTEALYQSLQQ